MTRPDSESERTVILKINRGKNLEIFSESAKESIRRLYHCNGRNGHDH